MQSKGIYYYTTYDNHQITAIYMHKEKLKQQRSNKIYPITEEQINDQN